MSEIDSAQATLPLGRLRIIDVARGVAIVAMIVYHLFWDLSYFRLIGIEVSIDPIWISFQHSIVATFLTLVGVGLTLSHGNGIRWPAFWRRFVILLGAALIVTAATYWMFPDSFVYFGVLHAIAVFSLLALPFVRLPVWSAFAAAAVIIAVPVFYQSPVFTEKALSWIGLWTVPPPTNDLVAMFPWLGFVLLGVGIGQLITKSPLGQTLARFGGSSRLSRVLAFCGRWSLVIYLAHQPLLLGVIYPISARMTPELTRPEAFIQSCQPSCMASAGREKYCQAYCSCALGMIETDDLWAAVTALQPTAKDRQSIAGVTTVCSAVEP